MYTSENWKFGTKTTIRQGKLLLLQQLRTEEQIALFIKVQLDKLASSIEADAKSSELNYLKLLLETDEVKAINFEGSWERADHFYKQQTELLYRFLNGIAYGIKPVVMTLTCDIVQELIKDKRLNNVNRV